MPKISKAEQLRRKKLAAELEAVEKRLLELDIILANIMGRVAGIACKLYDKGGAAL